jgi:spore germination protein YaaH
MVNGLYTNRNAYGDFIRNVFCRLASHGQNVFIAVALTHCSQNVVTAFVRSR